LPTPDCDGALPGVAMIAGFGYGFSPDGSGYGETAVYLAGELIGLIGEGEGTSTSQRLARTLAPQASLQWVEWQAHANWARLRTVRPPATLRQYEAETVGFYEAADCDKTLYELSGDYTPGSEHQEGRLLSQAFGMSGGDLSTFDAWYAGWVEENGFFVELPDVAPWLKEQDALLQRRKSKTAEYAQLEQMLRNRWLEYLRQVWKAPKVLDAVAVRAGLRASL
jgi:hypothetical protein